MSALIYIVIALNSDLTAQIRIKIVFFFLISKPHFSILYTC